MKAKELFQQMVSIGESIAKEEGLPLKTIIEIPNLSFRHRGKRVVGLCHGNGTIQVYVPKQRDMMDRVKLQEGLRTICHELAHLKHMNHEPAFWEYQAVLCGKASVKCGVTIPPERSWRA